MRVLVAGLMLVGLSGCKGKLDGLRDALASEDVTAATGVSSPRCEEATIATCLSALGKVFGAKRDFDAKDPEHASAAAVAVVVLRERRADWVPAPETWFRAVMSAKGAGAESLRLAVATRMAEIAPSVAKKPDDEKEALEVARAIGTAIPGACATYALLAPGIDVEKMPPEKSPDHAPCVQRDLRRPGGPGGAYGHGGWRAAAGALALWKDEVGALQAGVEMTEGAAKRALQKKLEVIEAATKKIELKTVEIPGNAWQRAHEETGAIPETDAGSR